MKEKNLILFSIFIAISGIILLFIISKQIQINNTTIQKINNEQIVGTVKFNGIVKKISSSDKFTKITLSNQNEIEAVAFDNLSLSVNDKVKVTGKYNEDKTLIIDTIRLI